MDYDFGAKRHWRRWVWNRIAEKTPNRRDAIVVYLPGAKDFDRPIATERGFSPNNMIGVERSKSALSEARDGGALVVEADFFHGVDAISLKREIGVVFGDFCCGLSEKAAKRVVRWLLAPPLQYATFAFNILRGRDKSCEHVYLSMREDFGKDRGKIFVHWVLMNVAKMLDEAAGELGDADRAYRRYVYMLDCADPVFHSYMSESGQVFDTVVFKNPYHANSRKLDFDYSAIYKSRGLLSDKNGIAAKRSTAAVLAHKTMREKRIGIYK